jgi:hypothetical protein
VTETLFLLQRIFAITQAYNLFAEALRLTQVINDARVALLNNNAGMLAGITLKPKDAKMVIVFKKSAEMTGIILVAKDAARTTLLKLDAEQVGIIPQIKNATLVTLLKPSVELATIIIPPHKDAAAIVYMLQQRISAKTALMR